jgi:hypothetical protein
MSFFKIRLPKYAVDSPLGLFVKCPSRFLKKWLFGAQDFFPITLGCAPLKNIGFFGRFAFLALFAEKI